MRARARARENNDLQLDLFGLSAPRIAVYETTDAIRLDGREALAGIPAENGRGTGSERPAPRDVDEGGGEDGNGTRPASPPADAAGTNGATSARPGLGNGAGEMHLPDARAAVNGHRTPEIESAAEGITPVEPTAPDPEALRNQNNYRITDQDRLGAGSLKQKCRDNLAAIELLKNLELE